MSATAEGIISIPIVSVPDEQYMLTPGEVREVALDYTLFHTILQSGSTRFACIPTGDWSASPNVQSRGALLSILQVKNIVQGEDMLGNQDMSMLPRVMVECRCSGRVDVLRLSDYDFVPGVDAPPTSWKLVTGECTTVTDWSVWEFEDRRHLAMVEWDVWTTCKEIANMVRKHNVKTDVLPFVEQELAVWAPKTYDRDISEQEWEKTPVVTRDVWSQRAESFSFGILRCVSCGDDIMRRARSMTNTTARLELAMECVEKKKAMTQAKISLKNAFD